MSSLSSLVAYIPMGLALVILGAAVVTAVVDSRRTQRPQPAAGETTAEPCCQSKAA